VIALAAVSVAVGVALGALMLQRLDIGETWDDWMSLERPGWFNAAQVVLVAMLIAGLLLGGEAGVVLIGVFGGFIVVFITIGIRRRLGRGAPPEPRDPEVEAAIEAELDEELRESRRSQVGWFAATLLVSLAGGYFIVDLRGLELVGVAFGVAVLSVLSERASMGLVRWFARR
jgi:hypothetical protein